MDTDISILFQLDYTLTWQKLKDLFKTAGRVRHVDLKTDTEGKSRGFGTVEFETPEEAVMAIYLHNNKVALTPGSFMFVNFCNRWLTVAK